MQHDNKTVANAVCGSRDCRLSEKLAHRALDVKQQPSRPMSPAQRDKLYERMFPQLSPAPGQDHDSPNTIA